MLDLKFIRENPDVVRNAIAARNDSAPIDEILELDERRRSNLARLEELRRERKASSKANGEAAREKGRLIRDQIKNLEDTIREIEFSLNDRLLRVPNIPQPTVPIGKSEDDNIVAKTVGTPRQFDFTPLPHWDIGERLGMIDFEAGTRISGSRFYVLKGMGATLQRALIDFMLDMHIREHGYKETYLPVMVRQEALIGSSNLPKFADNLYRDIEEDFWFIPTAEVALTNLHRDEILSPEVLPLYYVAHTPCFRREKMSAGKDVRGIKRGHQFEKVEMYKFAVPGNSNEELEKMASNAEEICARLEIPYRIKELCTADISFASTRTYDIEMWAPGCNEWLEVSSCSNCGDFQARRANIRYRPEPEAKPEYVHTLNGSGLALPRVLISVIENYQCSDGTIDIPEVLRPYTGISHINQA
ncbi:MAG: serine--tRNA ligase [Dehalococcoidales bacterium]|jgi:seryl-tRNA synthetase|nr:serine--tRNA ligase [Dehalococcoidales bacterium]MDX9986842.1 serine--tRNA ligase [Dehalococcoidales bacterium]